MVNYIHFQVVNDAIAQLCVTLETIQAQAHNPNSALYNNPSARNCSDTFRHAVTSLRGEIFRDAYETAEFLLNDILISFLKDTVPRDSKKLMIDKFLYSPNPEHPFLITNKARKVADLRNTIEQLQRNLDACQQILKPMGFNSMAIHATFSTVIEGIRSIQSFYEQVYETLQSLRKQLDNCNIGTTTVRVEPQQLAIIANELKALLLVLSFCVVLWFAYFLRW